jgi:hypothetical protein
MTQHLDLQLVFHAYQMTLDEVVEWHQSPNFLPEILQLFLMQLQQYLLSQLL